MSDRNAFPLFPLVLAWTSAARVQCQTVEASLVSTQYVEITWERELLWFGVNKFLVDISSEGNSNCSQPVTCSTPTCRFHTSVCGLYQPCTPTNIAVTGGYFTAPALNLITGPESVTDMTLRLEEGIQYISWVNPSKDSSPCYKQTAVRVSFNDESSTDYFNHGNITYKALCVRGYGEVEVWAEGGNGHSISSWGTIVYNGSDVVNLVTYESCEPVECTSIEVKWSYAPVCPDVAYIDITLYYEVSRNESTNANSTTVTGLECDKEYNTCISAMSKDGKKLDSDCHSYCRTAYVVPQNLTVQPRSDSALRATWKPPVCQPASEIRYRLRVDYEDYYTTATSYDVVGLDDFRLYEVELGVDGYIHYDGSNTVSVDAFTKLSAPILYGANADQDSISVRWSFYESNDWGYDIYYKVTWGRNLTFYDETEEMYYYITGFSDTDEVSQVCVAAALREREDLTSHTDCLYVTESSVSEMEGWMIALIVVGVCLVAGLLTGAVLYMKKKSKAASRQQRQQQQRQQQQPPQYMYETHNPGASL